MSTQHNRFEMSRDATPEILEQALTALAADDTKLARAHLEKLARELPGATRRKSLRPARQLPIFRGSLRVL